MTTENDKPYYVYELSTPDGNVFYVGKGSGNRMNTHETRARGGEKGAKDEVIRQILAQGKRVHKQKVYQTNNEEDAFLYEWALIHLVYGHEKLANKEKGGRGRSTRSPGGSHHVQFTLSGEVVLALEQLRAEDTIGEATSRFVDNWLREHPQVREKLEQQQQKGTES